MNRYLNSHRKVIREFIQDPHQLAQEIETNCRGCHVHIGPRALQVEGVGPVEAVAFLRQALGTQDISGSKADGFIEYCTREQGARVCVAKGEGNTLTIFYTPTAPLSETVAKDIAALMEATPPGEDAWKRAGNWERHRQLNRFGNAGKPTVAMDITGPTMKPISTQPGGDPVYEEPPGSHGMLNPPVSGWPQGTDAWADTGGQEGQDDEEAWEPIVDHPQGKYAGFDGPVPRRTYRGQPPMEPLPGQRDWDEQDDLGRRANTPPDPEGPLPSLAVRTGSTPRPFQADDEEFEMDEADLEESVRRAVLGEYLDVGDTTDDEVARWPHVKIKDNEVVHGPLDLQGYGNAPSKAPEDTSAWYANQMRQFELGDRLRDNDALDKPAYDPDDVEQYQQDWSGPRPVPLSLKWPGKMGHHGEEEHEWGGLPQGELPELEVQTGEQDDRLQGLEARTSPQHGPAPFGDLTPDEEGDLGRLRQGRARAKDGREQGMQPPLPHEGHWGDRPVVFDGRDPVGALILEYENDQRRR